VTTLTVVPEAAIGLAAPATGTRYPVTALLESIPLESITDTEFLDFRSDAVQEFVAASGADEEDDPVQRAVRLYYAVRDDIRYEIYGADLSADGLRASSVATAGTGLCIHKSVLYAAALRAVGIPSRLLLTDVRNHLVSPQLKSAVGDIFHYHCLTVLRPEHHWVKATPVFPKMLCRMYGMKTLEFDGRNDSVHHPFDADGRRHMEFVRFHGEFTDLPYQTIIDGMRDQHAGLFAGPTRFRRGSLITDANEN
jgi:hypothetical protein